MDSEPVEMPLDYLQGHKDGLEWASQLAEANHPETGDWLYDDPIELAKAIRKGPDMPPSQPALDSEPVAYIPESQLDLLKRGVMIEADLSKVQRFDEIPLYRHAQPAPVVPEIDRKAIADKVYGKCSRIPGATFYNAAEFAIDEMEARRAAMLQAGNSPVIPESCSAKFGNFQHYWHSKGYVLVPTEPTESMCDISHIGVDVYCGITDDNEYYSIGGAEAAKVWKAMLAAADCSIPMISDRWIPVSERMPEVGDVVLIAMGLGGCVNVGEMERSGANYRYFTSVVSGRELPATHWMPLPAAPQEVR
ncbi:DUF551 domain-containing protein [Klebsiella grimontii]|uniref:DUF551 domain-containing protein n=1 Tax=Klebsiella grimontii TaxID=2058152 RepID=UPI003BF96A94